MERKKAKVISGDPLKKDKEDMVRLHAGILVDIF